MPTKINAQYALLGTNLDLMENICVTLSELENGSVVISDIEELDYEVKNNQILIPGFFNAHVHAVDIELRGIVSQDLEALVSPDGIKHSYLNKLSIEQIYQKLMISYNKSVNYGTVGWCDFREGGLIGLKPYNRIHNKNFIPFGRPKEDEMSTINEKINTGIRSVRAYSEKVLDELVKIIHGFNGLVWIHASEGEKLRNLWINEMGMNDIEYAISKNVDTIIHLTHADENDIELMNKMNTSGVICVRSNKFTNSGVPPVENLMKSGINLGIGTDNAMFHSLSMWDEIKSVNSVYSNPNRVLRMATTEGASLTGLDWGISKGNSNMLKLQLPMNVSRKNIIDVIVSKLDEKSIECIYV